MSFPTRLIATISVIVALSLETLTASAATQNPSVQQQSSASNPASTLIFNQGSPVLLARNTKRKTKKSKSRQSRSKTSSSSLINKYEDAYYRGHQAVYECIVEQQRNSATKECREMVTIKSSLINWCYKDSVACTYIDRMAADEIFWDTQITIMKPV